MTSEADAIAAVLEKVAPLPGSTVPLIDSLGRFAAQDAFAQRPLPSFDNSSMDGYAVQAASCGAGATLRVTGEQWAGVERGLTVGAGEAIRIFTGAPLPAGADAIIMQEDVKREGETIVPQCSVERGEFIRRKGSDLAEGQKILSRGERIAVQKMALLASQGIAEIEVGGIPRVAIVATGDELVRVGVNAATGTDFREQLHHAARAGARRRRQRHARRTLRR